MRQINEAFGIKPPFETDVIPKSIVSKPDTECPSDLEKVDSFIVSIYVPKSQKIATLAFRGD